MNIVAQPSLSSHRHFPFFPFPLSQALSPSCPEKGAAFRRVSATTQNPVSPIPATLTKYPPVSPFRRAGRGAQGKSPTRFFFSAHSVNSVLRSASAGSRVHRSSTYLSPSLATHPKNAPVSLLVATHPKTRHFKSFACHTYEKTIGGTPCGGRFFRPLSTFACRHLCVSVPAFTPIRSEWQSPLSYASFRTSFHRYFTTSSQGASNVPHHPVVPQSQRC